MSCGLNRVAIDPETAERLEKLLGAVESSQSVYGNGTMVLLGSSILHSRFPIADARHILQFHKCRPLTQHQSTRFTPVFLNNVWKNMYTIKLQHYTLVVTCHIDKPFTLLRTSIMNFQHSISNSKLGIPIEEPPVLMRTFAKRETIAFLYHNLKSGLTIFPAPRSGPALHKAELLGVFWLFYADAVYSIHLI